MSFWLKDFIFICFKGLEKSRKVFGNWFDLHLHFYLEFFSRVFLCNFNFQTLYFLTLELSILSIRIIVLCERIGLCFVETTKCCKPLSLLGFMPFPLSVEEVVQLGCWYPSKCRGD